ncbi:TPA: GMC oxidoreductase [Photobacterium damselae]
MKNILIIGAGLSGTVIANRLSKYNNITLVDIKNKNKTIPSLSKKTSNLASVPTFCYGLGGTANLWHNGLIHLNENDIDDNNYANFLKKISKYRSAAFEILTNNKVPYNEYNSEKQSSFHEIDRIFYPKEKYNFTLNENIEFIGDVCGYDVTKKDGKIEQVSLKIIDGNEIIKKIDTVILCAGGLNSPFLFNEFVSDDNKTDLKFIDHPMGFIGKIKIKKKYKKQFSLIASQNYNYGHFKSCFRLRDDESDRISCIYLRNAFTSKHNPEISVFKSKLGSSASLKDKIKVAFNMKMLHPDIILEVIKYFTGKDINTRTYSLMFVGDQKERINKISKDGDKLFIDWSVSKKDIEVYKNQINNFILNYQEYIECASIDNDFHNRLWSAAHYSSSINIGSHVNSKLQSHSVSNLYVCDGSIFNEHTYVNTGLSIVEAALYLTEEVIQ